MIARLFDRESLTGLDRLAMMVCGQAYRFDVPYYHNKWDAISWSNHVYFGKNASTRSIFGHILLDDKGDIPYSVVNTKV